jgi:hypothetical protein
VLASPSGNRSAARHPKAGCRVKPKSLTYDQERELHDLLDLRRSLSNKKLMQRFKVSASVLYRIQTRGPLVPRESLKKLTIEEAMQELRL